MVEWGWYGGSLGYCSLGVVLSGVRRGEARDLWLREDSLLVFSGSQHEFGDILGNKQGRNPILVHLLFTINAVSCILLTYKHYNTNPIIPEE